MMHPHGLLLSPLTFAISPSTAVPPPCCRGEEVLNVGLWDAMRGHRVAITPNSHGAAYGCPAGNGSTGSMALIWVGYTTTALPSRYCVITGKARMFWPDMGSPGG